MLPTKFLEARGRGSAIEFMEMLPVSRNKPWIAWVLWAAAIYNLVWGGFVILFPMLPFRLAGMEPPNYPEIWQCLGMVVGVYGVGYAIAATNPLRHWPIVLVGLLGKILEPIVVF